MSGNNCDIKGRKLSETINSLLIQGSTFHLILKQQEFDPNSLVLMGFRNEFERDVCKLICFCHNKTNMHYYKLKQPVNRNPRLSQGIK